MSFAIKPGHWLGIDIGSSRAKVCSFCLIEASSAGVVISFEKGPAAEPYPAKNELSTFIDPQRAPTYLRAEVEGALAAVLSDSELVTRWLEKPTAVAIDAPVALADDGCSRRLTEEASTQTFETPDRRVFERLLQEQSDPFHRINTFWKCIGIAVYRWFGTQLEFSQATLAAQTCTHGTGPRLRETFPSDVYKRANGTEGVLEQTNLTVLKALVHPEVEWRGAGGKGRKPSMDTLYQRRDLLRTDLASNNPRQCEMRRHGGTSGDLWDAFACAFTACCEDHDGAVLHGAEAAGDARQRLLREGAILTVRSRLKA